MSLHIEDMDKKNLGEVKKTVSVSTEELRRLHEIDAIEAEQKIVENRKFEEDDYTKKNLNDFYYGPIEDFPYKKS